MQKKKKKKKKNVVAPFCSPKLFRVNIALRLLQKKKKKKKKKIKFSEMKPAEKVSFFLIDLLRPLALKGITFKAMYSLVLKSSF